MQQKARSTLYLYIDLAYVLKLQLMVQVLVQALAQLQEVQELFVQFEVES
jgi:hypothetical protein